MPSLSPPLPPEVDLSYLLSPARDQGPRGTCTAFATTALHEAAIAAEKNIVLSLSEEVLYWGAKQVDKNHTPGTSFHSADLALRRWGQPEAGLWPYDPVRIDTNASYAPPPEAIVPANCHCGRLEPVALDLSIIKTHLAAGQAVATMVQMSLAFYRAINGVVSMPQASELFSENHAILLTGYRDADSVFRFRNSWSTNWGIDGYGTLSYDYLTQHGKSAYLLHTIT